MSGKRRGLCVLLCAALLLGGAAGLFLWADRQYAHRLAEQTRTRYQDGVLQGEDFRPLDGAESAVLFERAAAPPALLSTGTGDAEPAAVLAPYLPDYGSNLDLRRTDGLWRLSYHTLDGLEVRAYYSAAGQAALQVYLPEPDLEVRFIGEVMSYTPHARRSVSLSGLWTALTFELSVRL